MATDYIKELFEIPVEKRVLSVIAIGYSEETKKPFDMANLMKEKIHWGKY